MPKVPGANLNTSNIAGSTNCDLLVPVTYIDAGCMNSLPLLFPFEESQQTNITEPTNETFYGNFTSVTLLPWIYPSELHQIMSQRAKRRL